MTPSPRTRLLALLATAVAGTAATAAPASATVLSYTPTGAECTLSQLNPLGLQVGHVLTDALGYGFDTTSNLTLLLGGEPFQYATLAYGGSTTAVPGRTLAGAYDNWGDLYVGSTESRYTQYLDADPLGCTSVDAGQGVDFATTTIGGLKVRRQLFVPSTGTGAARLVESVQNPSASPVTTSVFVGDMTSNLHEGTLGSDAQTTVGPTSSGDTAIDGDDNWAVTTDGHGIQPALAHVWNGAGLVDRATIELTGTQGGNESLDTGHQLAADQFGYGWQNITIPAGGTASYLSWEVMRGSAATGGYAARDAAQAQLAATAAASLASAPASTTFQGMTPAEIASVRNWAKPVVDATIAPVSGATTATDTTLSATSVNFGSSTLSQCDTGTVHWDFGDGTSADGMGGAHRFAAGQANVTVTVDGACGGVTTKHLSFWVDTPAQSTAGTASSGGVSIGGDGSSSGEPSTPAGGGDAVAVQAVTASAGGSAPAAAAGGTPAPATNSASQLVLTAMPKIAATQIQKKGVDATVQSTVGGSVRFVLTGTGIKMVKVVSLPAGPATTTTLKFPASAYAALKTVKTLTLRAKLTPAGGADIITTRPITVHH